MERRALCSLWCLVLISLVHVQCHVHHEHEHHAHSKHGRVQSRSHIDVASKLRFRATHASASASAIRSTLANDPDTLVASDDGKSPGGEENDKPIGTGNPDDSVDSDDGRTPLKQAGFQDDTSAPAVDVAFQKEHPEAQGDDVPGRYFSEAENDNKARENEELERGYASAHRHRHKGSGYHHHGVNIVLDNSNDVQNPPGLVPPTPQAHNGDHGHY